MHFVRQLFSHPLVSRELCPLLRNESAVPRDLQGHILEAIVIGQREQRDNDNGRKPEAARNVISVLACERERAKDEYNQRDSFIILLLTIKASLC